MLKKDENGNVVTICCEVSLRRHVMGNWLCSGCGTEVKV